MSPIIQARLSQLLLTSLYEDSGKGTLRLVGDIDLKTPPWFWPPVAEISCKQKKITYGGPPWGGNSEFRGGVQPKTPPGGWTDIVDQTEDGRKILVGRIPHWDEFWSGSPPTNLKSEIPHADVDTFLNGLMRGMPMSAGAFFEDRPLRLYEALPPKMILGSFPSGPYREGGPRGPDPRYPLDPYRKDTGTEPRLGDSSNCWERICCIGLDVEKREVTAIVEITQSSGYGGDLCSSTAFESVGFWLIEPSRAEVTANEWPDNPNPNPNSTRPGDYCGGNVRFVGAKRIPVADIPRSEKGNAECLNPIFQYDAGSLRYSVSLPLSEDDLDLMKKCSEASPRLPVLHAVVTWNADVKNENFGGRGLRFGDWDSEVVQYPVPTVKKLTREIAVGLLSDECPYVRYSNVVWPKEIKAVEFPKVVEGQDNPPVQLEKLAIDVTATIKAKIDVHGAMRLFVVSADYESKLLRRRIIARQDINRQTPAIQLTGVPPNSVLTPFDLDVGDWIICAAFAHNNAIIAWDPERDLVLSGYGESLTTTCLGLYRDLRKREIKMVGPLDSGILELNYRRPAASVNRVLDYPPCVVKIEQDPIDVIESHNFIAFFSVEATSEGSLDKLRLEPNGDAGVIVISMARGSRWTADDSRFYNHYLKIIEQLVLLGYIVVVPNVSTDRNPYFLYDVLPEIDANLTKTFPNVGSFQYVLFGHSNGGDAVRYALATKDKPESDARAKTAQKIAGGILLAPALPGDALIMNRSPSLVIAGGLDDQIPFKLLECTDDRDIKTGKVSESPFSPITAWEMSQSTRSYLLFVKGATHYRWINSMDDFTQWQTSNEDLETKLVLDGDNLSGSQPLYPQRHESLLLSYVTYFTLAYLSKQSNYLQMLVPGVHIPPDVRKYNAAEHLDEAYALYFKGRSSSSMNSLTSDGSETRYLGHLVKRRIVVDGRTVSGYKIEKANMWVEAETVIPFYQKLLFVSGRDIEMSYEIGSGLKFQIKEAIAFNYMALGLQGEVTESVERFTISIHLSDGRVAMIPILDRNLNSAGYEVTQYTLSSDNMIRVQGKTAMVKQLLVPLSWALDSCFVSESKTLSIDRIAFKVKNADTPIVFGVGLVQIVSG